MMEDIFDEDFINEISNNSVMESEKMISLDKNRTSPASDGENECSTGNCAQFDNTKHYRQYSGEMKSLSHEPKYFRDGGQFTNIGSGGKIIPGDTAVAHTFLNGLELAKSDLKANGFWSVDYTGNKAYYQEGDPYPNKHLQLAKERSQQVDLDGVIRQVRDKLPNESSSGKYTTFYKRKCLTITSVRACTQGIHTSRIEIPLQLFDKKEFGDCIDSMDNNKDGVKIYGVVLEGLRVLVIKDFVESAASQATVNQRLPHSLNNQQHQSNSPSTSTAGAVSQQEHCVFSMLTDKVDPLAAQHAPCQQISEPMTKVADFTNEVIDLGPVYLGLPADNDSIQIVPASPASEIDQQTVNIKWVLQQYNPKVTLCEVVPEVEKKQRVPDIVTGTGNFHSGSLGNCPLPDESYSSLPEVGEVADDLGTAEDANLVNLKINRSVDNQVTLDMPTILAPILAPGEESRQLDPRKDEVPLQATITEEDLADGVALPMSSSWTTPQNPVDGKIDTRPRSDQAVTPSTNIPALEQLTTDRSYHGNTPAVAIKPAPALIEGVRLGTDDSLPDFEAILGNSPVPSTSRTSVHGEDSSIQVTDADDQDRGWNHQVGGKGKKRVTNSQACSSNKRKKRL